MEGLPVCTGAWGGGIPPGYCLDRQAWKARMGAGRRRVGRSRRSRGNSDHPVYTFEVCKHSTLASCRGDHDEDWTLLGGRLNAESKEERYAEKTDQPL